jgi:MoaA/NifB/PqqE/SkfB family radical SAM enzyme
MTDLNKKYHWICPDAFSGINITTTGDFRPCCVMSTMHENSPHFEEIFNISKNTYKEFYQSKFMSRLRDAMINGGDDEFLDSACFSCRNTEKAGVKSTRQKYISKFESNNIFSHKYGSLVKNIESGSSPEYIHTLHVDGLGGNYCNLTCSMCHEYSSSSILNEKLKLNEKITIPIKVVNGKPSPLLKETPCEEFKKELDDLINKTVEIKLAGGEPLLAKENYELLKMVSNPSEKYLRITTNGTISFKKFHDLAKTFKEVTVNISLDGVGKVNDYIRYPSKWNDILNNYLYLKRNTNYHVLFSSTVSALNVERLHEVALKFPRGSYTFPSYVYNTVYSLESVPDDIKARNLDILYKHKHLDHVPILISRLENAKFDESRMKEMIEHIKRRDRLRGTNLLDVFPEWRPYYDRSLS